MAFFLEALLGGLMAGIGTVGVQNAARTAIQATGDSPMRRTIKLDRLNRNALEFSYGSLELLKKALKDSLREPGVEATGQADIQAIEDAISEALKEAQQNPKAKTHLAVTICTQLEQLPQGDRKRLLAEVKTRLKVSDVSRRSLSQVLGEPGAEVDVWIIGLSP